MYSNAWSKDSKLEYPRKPRPITEKDAEQEKREEQRVQMERLFSYVATQARRTREEGIDDADRD